MRGRTSEKQINEELFSSGVKSYFISPEVTDIFLPSNYEQKADFSKPLFYTKYLWHFFFLSKPNEIQKFYFIKLIKSLLLFFNLIEVNERETL